MKIHLRAARRKRQASRFPASPRAGRRPLFELLEARQMLAVVSWDGGGGTPLWSNPLNWSNDQLPTAADDVQIGEAFAGNAIVVQANVTINSLTAAAPLTIQSGTFSLSSASVVADVLTLSGGTLSGAGDLTITGELVWSDGTLAGAGKTIVAAGGELNITGAGGKFLGRTLENAGAATYGGTNLRFGPASSSVGVINNLAGASFTVNAGGSFGDNWANPNHAFNNYGAFVKQGEGTTVFSGVAFHNNGSIDVQQGRLQLASGGSTSGNASIGGGAVELIGGTYALNEGANVTGSGALAVAGGTLNVAGEAALTNLALTAGTLSGDGDLTIEGVLDWSAGTLAGAGRAIVAAGGGLNIAGAGNKFLGRTLENAGAALYSGTNLRFGPTSGSVGVINNLAGASFTVNADGSFGHNWANPNHAFNNVGAFVKQGEGTTTVFSSAAFNNYGSIDVQGGRLQLALGGSTSGDASIVGGAVELTGGTYTLNEGANVTGNGVLAVTAATLNVAGAASASNVTLSGGELSGDGDLTVAGVLDWSAGTLAGAGRAIVAAGGELNITGAGSKFLGRTLENAGAATYGGTNLRFGPASSSVGVINNLAGASFTVNAGGSFGDNWANPNHAFNNYGAFVKQGEGTTVFSSAAFNNYGSIDVQQGALQLAGGGSVFQLDGMDRLSLSNETSIDVPAGLIGTTTNADLFSILGTVTLQGGSAANPSPMEVMGQDLGAVAAGFHRNFAYDRLQLQWDYVRLQDASNNATGAGAEALYVNTLVVPSGATLDLNGLTVYARTTQITGAVLNGTINVVPDGGMLLLGIPVSGSIGAPQAIDEWTFYGRSGRAAAILADPLTSLQRVQIEVLDPSGATIANAASDANGETVALLGVELTTDGVYRVRISAAESVASNVGAYRLAAFDATVDVNPLMFNQRHIGALETPYSADHWTFSSTAGEALRFDWLNSSSPSIRFRLTGPDGWVGFDGINADSDVLVAPAAGDYVLEAFSSGHASGRYAFQMLRLSATDLTVGVPYAGALARTGDAQLFKVELTEPGPLSISFEGAVGGNVEAYARLNAPPTRRLFDARNEGVGTKHETIVPLAAPGTWYVLLYGAAVPASGAFTLHADDSAIRLTGVTPDVYGANATVLVSLTGAGFLAGTTVELARGGSAFPAEAVTINAFDRLTATFNLSGRQEGVYDVRVTRPDGETAVLASGFRIIPQGAGVLDARLILPSVAGPSSPATIYVEYANTGNSALVAPILTLQSGDPDGSDRPLLTLDHSRLADGFWSSGVPEGFANSVQIYATGAMPGLLLPGERVTVPVYYAGLQRPFIELDQVVEFELLAREADDLTPIDWDELAAALQPSWISDAAWSVVVDNLRSEIGNAWGDYVRALGESAVRLHQLGSVITSAADLYAFEFQQAIGVNPLGVIASRDAASPTPERPLEFVRTFAGNVVQRHRAGWLGYGWSTSWEIEAVDDGHIETIASGGEIQNVFILDAVVIRSPDGTERRFMPDRRHPDRFLSPSGETAALRKLTVDGTVGGSRYELSEANGRTYRFYAFGDLKGQLEYTEDANGNRTSVTYTESAFPRPTALVHSSGASIQFTYNGQGRIASVADSTGWTTAYAYDSSGRRLITATDPSGTTAYDYFTGADSAREHALRSITDPSGVTRHFEYDSRGRVSATYVDAGAGRLDFDYSNGGALATTDATGRVQRQYFNHLGQVVRTEDAAGAYINYAYNDAGQVIRETDSLGRSRSYVWCGCGSLASFTDENGNTATFAPGGPLNRPVSVTDARGNTTRYAYDAEGNRTSTIYPDGSIERATYDPAGNATSSTNRQGQTTHLTYNSFGQVTQEVRPDGSSIDYVYDSRQRLIEITDSQGATHFEYDSGDRLTRVEYPNGRWLEYDYDDAGRRSLLADHAGLVVRYQYNSAGWLSELRDAADSLIVRYTYDAAGRLVREDKGNGSWTTYTHDDVGRLQKIVHHAADGVVNAQAAYGYDAVGNRTSMATLDGVWTYAYDLSGQLVRADFESHNSELPHQSLAYEYDSLGNRVRTVANGAEDAYTANALNQYSNAGQLTYQYDRNGNLIEEIGPDGARKFRYDATQQLVLVASPQGVWEYEYDALGNRSAVIFNGQRTEFLLDPTGRGNVIGEYNSDNLRTVSYAYGSGLEAATRDGDRYYYDFDALGSTVGISGEDGAYLNRYSYAPFGDPLRAEESIANPFQFIGRDGVMSDDSGLLYMRRRYYAPGQGRFVAQDPIRLGGGDVNLYRYVFNNPLRLSDPTGLRAPPDPPCDDESESEIESDDGTFATEITGANLFPCGPGGLGGGGAGTGNQGGDDDDGGGEGGDDDDGVGNGGSGSPGPLGPIDVPQPRGPLLPGGAGGSRMFRPTDPNEKHGASGYGPEAFIAGDALIPYRVHFENLGPGSNPTPAQPATSPAQMVEVDDQLSEHLDWSTLQFTEFGFGDFRFAVPPGRQYHFEVVPVAYDGETFDVEVEMSFQPLTGQLRVVFTSVDPGTQLPPDVLTGFLPPEDGTGIGQGYFGFTIQPKAGLPTGTEIRNVALIKFDGQTVIATNQVDPLDASKGTNPDLEALNTIDAAPPASRVEPLPAEVDQATFLVSWTGADDVGGSGVAAFDVYASVNGGPFALWLDDTPDAFAYYDGKNGDAYAFYSVARDNVGHVEGAPAAPDATIRVELPPPAADADFDADGHVDGADFLRWQRGLGASGPNVTRADGDANHDFVVDAVDLNAWMAAFVTPPPWDDLDGDDDIDGADFLIWQRGLGASGLGAGRPNGDATEDSHVDVGDLAVWKATSGQRLEDQEAAAALAPPSRGDYRAWLRDEFRASDEAFASIDPIAASDSPGDRLAAVEKWDWLAALRT